MAAEAAKTSSSADSYIGSLISLTSKSEIRYEGILYSINTEESSIGLRNVRSFGTEGRKKDGLQVAPSDKVYEYILFRGSDIKDLQVKSSPPVLAASSSPIDNDPAIIQSHFPRPASAPTTLQPAISASATDVNSHAPQLGHLGSNFQGVLPLYPPGGNLGSWGPSPPPGANGSGLAMPMYWPGFYGPPNGLPHLPQQTLFRPPTGLSMPPSLQQPMQFSAFNPSLSAGSTNLPGSKLPEIPPSLVTSSSISTSLTSSSSPQLNLHPIPLSSLASETLSNLGVSKAPNSVLLSTPSFPSISPLAISPLDASNTISASSGKVNEVSSSSLPNLSISQTTSSIVSSSPSQTEKPTPSLVTPEQLLPSGQVPSSSSPFSQVAHKDVEVVQVTSSSSSSVVKEALPPILPLPPVSRAPQKPSGATFQPRHSYNYRGHGRGRERGRGRGGGTSRAGTRFTEDFDFMAMNEKFKKDEVWGHLGKNNKDKEGNTTVNVGDGSEEEGEEPLPQIDVKPVYNKDDFFDTLSSNTLGHDSQNGRTRFSEQLKIDAETFGDFVRYRGGRGGRGPSYGARGRGSYYGRGYGYAGRGRGPAKSTRAS